MKHFLSRAAQLLLVIAVAFAGPDARASHWQNPVNPLDVDGDGTITTFDAQFPVNVIMLAIAGAPGSAIPNEPNFLAPLHVDVNGDDFLTGIDSLLVINHLELGGPGATSVPDNAVRVRLGITDLGGNAISSIGLGESFRLQAFVQDTRGLGSPSGVFAAFTEIGYSPTLAAANGATQFASGLPLAYRDLAPGLLKAGAIANPTAAPPGNAEQLLFSQQFIANALGTVTFNSGPTSGLLPIFDTLVYGADVPVPLGSIDFGSVQLTIVPEPSSIALAAIGCVGVGLLHRRRRVRS